MEQDLQTARSTLQASGPLAALQVHSLLVLTIRC